jgi:hypothetical protein
MHRVLKKAGTSLIIDMNNMATSEELKPAQSINNQLGLVSKLFLIEDHDKFLKSILY